jgi:hypothetical protein
MLTLSPSYLFQEIRKRGKERKIFTKTHREVRHAQSHMQIPCESDTDFHVMSFAITEMRESTVYFTDLCVTVYSA